VSRGPQPGERPGRPWFFVQAGNRRAAQVTIELAQAAIERSHRVALWCLGGSAARQSFQRTAQLNTACSGSELTQQVMRAVIEEDPALVAVTNPAACPQLLLELWQHDAWTVCLETDWTRWDLVQQTVLHRFDRLLVFMPREVWSRGLRDRGGPHAVPLDARHLVDCVGWPASAQRKTPREKLVMLVLGPGSSTPAQDGRWQGPHSLAGAIDEVQKRIPELSWRAAGHVPEQISHLIDGCSLCQDEWDDLAASAALLVTSSCVSVPAAAAAGTPILALAPGYPPSPTGPMPYAHSAAAALARSDTAVPCFGELPAPVLSQRMIDLLRAGLRKPQPAEGVAHALKRIEGFLAP